MENQKVSRMIQSLRGLEREADWNQKPTGPKGHQAQFSLIVTVPLIVLKTGNSFPQGQTHLYLRLAFLKLGSDTLSHDLSLC